MFKRVSTVCALVGAFALPAFGDEVSVQNDSLEAGDNASVCPCFVGGEEAAVWLTSPCDGTIVALQIMWRSQFGGAAQVLEDSILVYEGGTFPNPGPLKDALIGPVLSDGGLNEYRFEDENQTIPIDIPVTAGEEFVVSLRFFNSNAGDIFAPSVLFDDSGIIPGKNAIKAIPGGWQSSESVGLTGDWIIRAIVDCSGGFTGSSCLQDGSCVDNVTEEQSDLLGGVWSGPGSTCATAQCLGACEIPATGACLQLDNNTCGLVGGNWFGPGTTECVSACPADFTGDGQLDFFDVSAFLSAFAAQDPSADFTDDGQFDFFDVSGFLSAFGQGCP